MNRSESITGFTRAKKGKGYVPLGTFDRSDAALEALVERNPRMSEEQCASALSSIRSGRALIEPKFRTRQAQVRWRVRHLTLHALDRATRRDAARDPGLEWDEANRTYRRARNVAPAPSLPRLDSAEPAPTGAV